MIAAADTSVAGDASYLVLAKLLNVPLLTGDVQLRRVAGEQGVTVLTP